MEREEKQGTYFPVYPNLRDAKSLRIGAGGKKREKDRGKVGEEKKKLVIVTEKQENRVMNW